MMRILIFGLVLLAAGLSGLPAGNSQVRKPLMNANQLADWPGIIIDIRPDADYKNGHIPGAVSAPYGVFGWRTSRYDRPAVLPKPEQLAKRLSRLGLTRTSPVVIAAEDMGLGALIYWTLASLGHESLCLLDGGMHAWREAGLSLARGESSGLPPASYKPKPRGTIVADEDFVIDLFDNVRVAIDCRSELYWGGEKGGPAQDDFGTIQDALNLDSARLRTPSGRYRPLKELEELFTRKGVINDRTAFFGYDGRHAALCWFALHELVGNRQARIYDGGIVDWEKNGHDIWNLTDGMGAR